MKNHPEIIQDWHQIGGVDIENIGHQNHRKEQIECPAIFHYQNRAISSNNSPWRDSREERSEQLLSDSGHYSHCRSTVSVDWMASIGSV